MIGIAALAAWFGCAEYSLTLTQVSTPPLPVVVDEGGVELPVGIAVTVRATGYRNGEPEDIDVTLEGDAFGEVLDVAPVPTDDTGGANYALIGVAPGETEIAATVKGHDVPPIPVVVTAQE